MENESYEQSTVRHAPSIESLKQNSEDSLSRKDSGISIRSQFNKPLVVYPIDIESSEASAGETNACFAQDTDDINSANKTSLNSSSEQKSQLHNNPTVRGRSDSDWSSDSGLKDGDYSSLASEVYKDQGTEDSGDLRCHTERSATTDTPVCRRSSVRFAAEPNEDISDHEDVQENDEVLSVQTEQLSTYEASPTRQEENRVSEYLNSHNRTELIRIFDINRRSSSCFRWLVNLLPCVTSRDCDVRKSDSDHLVYSESTILKGTRAHGYDNQVNVEAAKSPNQHARSVSQNFSEGHLQMEGHAAAYLTDKGGRIVIQNSGISLYVPAGALPGGKLQLIYIEVIIRRRNRLPRLDEGETWLTPTVKCGPSGLQFQKDVFLTMPHSATDIRQWNISPQHSKSNEWEKSESLVIKHDVCIIMMMDHFCGQKISGSPNVDAQEATKEMNVTVYQEKSAKENMRIWVRLTNAFRHVEKGSFGAEMLDIQPDEYYGGPNAPSLDFMNKPRYRRICCAFDYLSRVPDCEKGWEAVADKLGLNVPDDYVECVNTQRLQSPASQFLNTFFKQKKGEKVDQKGALIVLKEACRAIDSSKPASIIEEELEEIDQVKLEMETKWLRRGTVRVSNTGEDIALTFSVRDESGKIKEMEEIVPLKSVWSASDEDPMEDRATKFELTDDGHPTVTIRVSQGENEGCNFLCDIEVFKQDKQSENECTESSTFQLGRAPKKRTKIYPSVPIQLDGIERTWSVDLNVTLQKAIFQKVRSVPSDFREAFEIRAWKHGQTTEDATKDLFNAIDAIQEYSGNSAFRTTSVMSADSGFTSIDPDFLRNSYTEA